MKSENWVAFRTETQMRLFEEEIQGQLSDGHWENEDTDRRLWNCLVLISDIPDISFQATHKKDLTDLLYAGITQRMLEIGRRIKKSYDEEHLQNDLVEIQNAIWR